MTLSIRREGCDARPVLRSRVCCHRNLLQLQYDQAGSLLPSGVHSLRALICSVSYPAFSPAWISRGAGRCIAALAPTAAGCAGFPGSASDRVGCNRELFYIAATTLGTANSPFLRVVHQYL